MKTTLLAAALALGLAVPALAEQPVPPTATQKAGQAVGQALTKAVEAAKPAAAQPAAKGATVNLNKASPAELDALPKIGEARTKAIIAGRPYKSVQELLDRKILPHDAYDAIKDKVGVN